MTFYDNNEKREIYNWSINTEDSDDWNSSYQRHRTGAILFPIPKSTKIIVLNKYILYKNYLLKNDLKRPINLKDN
jgi:hypothetical protein